jgi:multidrug efflux system membrane fusion protein
VGDVTFVDNAVQEGTGTVTLRATISNAAHRLWPGRFVKVRLILSNKSGAVLIPVAATQMSARGPFVYVIHDDSTAELRQVVTGQRQGDLVVVESGLAAGERVVTNGHLGVVPKGKVQVVEAAQPAAPAKSEGSK